MTCSYCEPKENLTKNFQFVELNYDKHKHLVM